MKRVKPDKNWPESWKLSYIYDLEEIYGEITNHGYAYAYENRRKKALGLLSDSLPTGASVLDIAAGSGNFSLSMAEMGYKVTWNDLRDNLVDYVRQKMDFGEIVFSPGNAFELSFSEQFDGILMTEIIEHVAHPDDFLKKAANLVKPGGTIIMTTPNGAYFRNKLPKFSACTNPEAYESSQFKPNSDGHIFLLHPEEIAVLAEHAGLVVEKMLLITTPLTNGHMKTSYLLKMLPRKIIWFLEAAAEKLPEFLRRKFMLQMAIKLKKVKK